jgi:mediator of RNA polymerase II transcription subunit 22
MSDVPQTDVSRPSALPTAHLQRTATSQSLVDQNSAEYLDGIEEEWNKRVDMEVETLVDGMVDLVTLASVIWPPSHSPDPRLTNITDR